MIDHRGFPTRGFSDGDEHVLGDELLALGSLFAPDAPGSEERFDRCLDSAPR